MLLDVFSSLLSALSRISTSSQPIAGNAFNAWFNGLESSLMRKADACRITWWPGAIGLEMARLEGSVLRGEGELFGGGNLEALEKDAWKEGLFEEVLDEMIDEVVAGADFSLLLGDVEEGWSKTSEVDWCGRLFDAETNGAINAGVRKVPGPFVNSLDFARGRGGDTRASIELGGTAIRSELSTSRWLEDGWMAGVDTEARESVGVMKETWPGLGAGEIGWRRGCEGSMATPKEGVVGEMARGVLAGEQPRVGVGAAERVRFRTESLRRGLGWVEGPSIDFTRFLSSLDDPLPVPKLKELIEDPLPLSLSFPFPVPEWLVMRKKPLNPLYDPSAVGLGGEERRLAVALDLVEEGVEGGMVIWAVETVRTAVMRGGTEGREGGGADLRRLTTESARIPVARSR
jgi:hypothetical protein